MYLLSFVNYNISDKIIITFKFSATHANLFFIPIAVYSFFPFVTSGKKVVSMIAKYIHNEFILSTQRLKRNIAPIGTLEDLRLIRYASLYLHRFY